MTSKLDTQVDKDATNNSNRVEPSHQPAKPEVLRGGKIKLFVLLLCAISFFAGWKAYQARQANACIHLGGQMVAHELVMVCHWGDKTTNTNVN